VLTFFDGSESQLATDSELQVERADYDSGPNILLNQMAGVTTNRVIPLPAGGSFETDTPTAIGLVRGTSYVVSVAPADSAAATVSSIALLTDRDVQVSSPGLSSVIDLTHAGDVGATGAQSVASGQLSDSTLADLEDAAKDLHDGQRAQRVAAHVRDLTSVLEPTAHAGAPADTVGQNSTSDASDDQPRASAPPTGPAASPNSSSKTSDRHENDNGGSKSAPAAVAVATRSDSGSDRSKGKP
jgi:hypothetical protein